MSPERLLGCKHSILQDLPDCFHARRDPSTQGLHALLLIATVLHEGMEDVVAAIRGLPPVGR